MNKKINDVRPFQALHFNPDKIGNIGLCLSQPYDVIGPDLLETYLSRHENNIVRLTLGKIIPGDTDANNRYTRAKATLADWKKRDIIHRSQKPSFWVYEQEFEHPYGGTKKMKGFIGLVRLEDYESMRILPHEKVLKNPVEDRIRLTKTTNTQFEYIWGIYRDRGSRIDRILDECEHDAPIIDFLEERLAVRHRFWRLADATSCATIHAAMEELKIYIADGHHRYQTMLDIRDEQRKLHPEAGPDAPWEFIMMFLVNSEHEGLTILPTHRMIHGLDSPDWQKLEKSISRYFSVKEYSFTSKPEESVRNTLFNDIRTMGEHAHVFGLALKKQEKYLLLALEQPELYKRLVPADTSEAWRMLDVNIVNFLLLREIFGISEEELKLGEKIKYAVDPHEAVENVRHARMDAAVILNPTRFDDVIAIADNKEIMPRKSTYFYPKPLSGLVMFGMD